MTDDRDELLVRQAMRELRTAIKAVKEAQMSIPGNHVRSVLGLMTPSPESTKDRGRASGNDAKRHQMLVDWFGLETAQKLLGDAAKTVDQAAETEANKARSYGPDTGHVVSILSRLRGPAGGSK